MLEKCEEILTNSRRVVLVLTGLLLSVVPLWAAAEYRTLPEYISLRNKMHHAFNEGDSARLFVSVHQ